MATVATDSSNLATAHPADEKSATLISTAPLLDTEPTIAARQDRVSFEEWRDCTEITFEWADSYDTKDWSRLAAILAPTVHVNYASVNDYYNDALPAADFVSMMSSPGFLGDPNVDTQHHMGACKLRKVAHDRIEGEWQIRAAHQRYRDGGVLYPGAETTAKTKKGERAVLLTGHSHATITLRYRKVDGAWKWAGITTDIRWNENGFDKMFTGFEAGKAA